MKDSMRAVDLSLYLDVLSVLPDVTDGEIDEARAAFLEAFNDYMGEAVFDAHRRGDGDIRVNCDWSEIYEGKDDTYLHLNERGEIFNREIDFHSRISFRLARYFIASLFGMGELSKSVRADFYGDPLDPAASDRRHSPYVSDLVEGVRLLYQCAAKRGSVEACADSKGMKMIDGVKKKQPKPEPPKTPAGAAWPVD